MNEVEGYMTTIPQCHKSGLVMESCQSGKAVAEPTRKRTTQEHHLTWTPHTTRWEGIRCLFRASTWWGLFHPLNFFGPEISVSRPAPAKIIRRQG